MLEKINPSSQRSLSTVLALRRYFDLWERSDAHVRHDRASNCRADYSALGETARGDGDGDDAQANDDQTGIEHVRVARGVLRVLLGPRTVGNDNPKLQQRGNDATSDGECECYYWKRKSTP